MQMFVTGCTIFFIYFGQPPQFSASFSCLSSFLSFPISTFWLCKSSLLYPPVSCLIIEVSVCLWGALQYLLIKASVCVCLFISCCYFRHSPGGLVTHKPALPTEVYTVSCHCTSSHSKHCQNEISSTLSLTLYIFLYVSQLLADPCHLDFQKTPVHNENHTTDCYFPFIKSYIYFFFLSSFANYYICRIAQKKIYSYH